jgi:hypothetical protein
VSTVELEVPPGTVAVVLLSRTEDGDLQAVYAESRGQVPATREQVADALLRLAVEIDTQRTKLDDAEKGTGDA